MGLAGFATALLILSWAAFAFLHFRQRRAMEGLERDRRRAQAEETRVFAFLHGLGEAFTGELRTSDLYRMLVEGSVVALDAEGGALYIASRDGKSLIAGHVSKDCPPVIDIPEQIAAQSSVAPQVLENYLRIHTVAKGEGPLGTAWEQREALLLTGDDPNLAPLRAGRLVTGSALFAPLVYGGETIGALAVSNPAGGRMFDGVDLNLFRAIAEQSAFALFNSMVYREAGEKRRIDTDLRLARDIQRILLPQSVPVFDGFEISASNSPARYVSGDYFDFLPVDDDRLGIAIADVSGKGVAASLVSAMCRSVLRSFAPGNPSASAVIRQVNRQLFPDIKEDMFISMAYLLLDRRSGTISFCRAGHDAPLHYRAADRSVEKIKPPGMALGIDSGTTFDRVTSDFVLTMEPGDCLLLYTDGLTEAIDPGGAEFGIERTIQSIQSSAAKGANAIIDGLLGEVRSFIGDQPKNDDITLIAIQKT